MVAGKKRVVAGGPRVEGIYFRRSPSVLMMRSSLLFYATGGIITLGRGGEGETEQETESGRERENKSVSE